MHSAFPRPLLNSRQNAKVPGGSVSRRVHAQLQRTRPAPSQGEPSQSKPTNSNPSCSSGERGLGGEALLSEKRPLPPESQTYLLQTQKFPAALSAAGNTHIFKGTAPPLRRGNQVSQNQPTRTPAALQERGVWGERRFSQRSGLSPRKSDLPSPNAKVPGGSVSRREHAHLQRTRTTPSQGEPSQSKPTNSNPSRSSGERGLGERRFSQRSGLSPQKVSRYFTILMVWS